MRLVRPQTVNRTAQFDRWLTALADDQARRAIVRRLVRIEAGLFGDAKSVGGGVSEIRIDVGPGYRVYYHRQGLTTTLVIGGGDKSTQAVDIAEAQRIVAELQAQEKVRKKVPKKRK